MVDDTNNRGKDELRSHFAKAKGYSASEWVYPSDGEVWNSSTRLQYLGEVGSKLGFYNLNTQELAKRMGVSRRQIQYDLRKIYDRGIDPKSIRRVQIDLDVLHQCIIRELHGEMIRSKGKEKAALASTLLQASTSYLDFLTKCGQNLSSTAKEQIMHVIWDDGSGDVQKSSTDFND